MPRRDRSPAPGGRREQRVARCRQASSTPGHAGSPRAGDPSSPVTSGGGRGVSSVPAPHLGPRRVARVPSGAIIGLALPVALEQPPPKAGVVAGSLVATAVAV